MASVEYSPLCKTCNSARRLEIEAWCVGGEDPRAVEIRLKGLGEEISYNAIRSHMKNHYKVQEAAREKYHQSQLQIDHDVAKRLSDLEILDELIQDNHIIHSGLRSQIKDLDNTFSVPMPAVAMLNGVSDSICKAMKTKQELLGEDGQAKQADAIESLNDAEIDRVLAAIATIEAGRVKE